MKVLILKTLTMLSICLLMAVPSRAQLSNIEAPVADDAAADSLIGPKPIQDIKGDKKPLTNLEMEDVVKDEDVDSLRPQPIEENRGSADDSVLTNVDEMPIQKAPGDTMIKTREVEEIRGETDPVLTNMQVFAKERDGDVRFLISKGVAIEDLDFVLNFGLPLVPPRERKQIHSFNPSNNEQKHIQMIEYLEGLPNPDKVAQLQLCLSRRAVASFTLRYYRQWVESETGRPVPPGDALVQELQAKIETNDTCANELSPDITELDIIQSNEKYRPRDAGE